MELKQSFREIADQVKVRGRKDPKADVFKLVHDWLRDDKNGQWLLVLDNADDAAVLSPADHSSGGGSGSGGSAVKQRLSRYLPSSRRGLILVISWIRRAAMQVVEDSDVIPIKLIYDIATYALLYKKLRDKVDRSNSITKLATALEHMPLALI